MRRRTLMTLAGAGLLASAGSCGKDADGDGSEVVPVPTGEGKVSLAGMPWAECLVITELWRQVLTESGWTVEVRDFDDADELYRSLAEGEVDVFLDGWLPRTHDPYMRRYGEKIDNISFWYDDAALAIAVPDYVEDLTALDELDEYADLVGGRVLGVEASAGVMLAAEEDVWPYYNLEIPIEPSSTDAMLTSLERAVERREPVAVTLWTPHWAYEEFGLRSLTDPHNIFDTIETIHVFTRQGLESDRMRLASTLRSFSMNEESLLDLERRALRGGGSLEEGVSSWRRDNPIGDFLSTDN
ncbi:glycine betaine ABC transporter substrate-binding protein [Salininema proteolyticum]|uniref:Glycine betaine ABC transporter substrate-binding protein n=1 Tax=Salininema proteolyticum TaxID=1607685 RepID=A0ABV8U123_9ACTN